MVDAGISSEAAIGGFELAAGSKPRLLGISLLGTLASSGGMSVFAGPALDGGVMKQNHTVVTGTGATATVSFGAGSIVLDAQASDAVAGKWIIGNGRLAGENQDGDTTDDLDIMMAHGNFTARAGAAYVAAGTGAIPGSLNVTSINGGTVSFILSCPHEDSDDIRDGDGFFINLFAYARGGV